VTDEVVDSIIGLFYVAQAQKTMATLAEKYPETKEYRELAAGEGSILFALAHKIDKLKEQE